MIRKTIIAMALALVSFTSGVSAKDYMAVTFGIKADGVTLNTGSIQRAIDYISENGGGTLSFYVGRYLTGSFQLKSNVQIKLSGGAVLVFSPNAFDVQGSNGRNAMIYADGQENISVFGGGTLEGSARALNANIEEQAAKGHIADAGSFKPSLIGFYNCKKIKVSSLTFQNVSTAAVDLNSSEDVNISNVSVLNKDIPAMGFEFSGCKNVTVTGCYFDTEMPVKSDGTSSNLSFKNCKTVSGSKVELTK